VAGGHDAPGPSPCPDENCPGIFPISLDGQYGALYDSQATIKSCHGRVANGNQATPEGRSWLIRHKASPVPSVETAGPVSQGQALRLSSP
jgi:hypothetical protein